MNLSKSILGLAVCLLLLSACETYHISNQSLLEQFANSKKETKVNLIIAPPFCFFPGIVSGNNLQFLNCKDKYEKDYVLPVTNRTGIRITKKDSTRCTFYFDTLIIQDSTITGCKSHFVGVKIKPIKLDNVAKIELQK